jgi:hypothetical protein
MGNVAQADRADLRGESVPRIYNEFMIGETTNDYQPETTIGKGFRPKMGNTFEVPYIYLPADRAHVVDSGLGSPEMRAQVFKNINGRQHVRFYIHPESFALYAPLLKEFDVAGNYTASPTSSTRTVLAWNRRIETPAIFLKLSLAQIQAGLGRIVPSWEIRRAVGITSMVNLTPQETWDHSGASIIPEFAGVYVDSREKLGYRVDERQGMVFEHGLIFRDSSFLEKYKNQTVVPLFSLFSKRDTKPPMIIELWRNSGIANFVDFIDEYLFIPFIEKNRYLMFHEGIIPEIHGQNVLLVLDRKSKKIEHILHRDIGSMKVDLRLRMMNGLSIAPLKSKQPDKDFGLSRASEKFEQYFRQFFVGLIFRSHYDMNLQKYVPNYSADAIEARLLQRLSEATDQIFQVEKITRSVGERLEAYYAENSPPNLKIIEGSHSTATLSAFVSRRRLHLQVMDLPSRWREALPSGRQRYFLSEYGVLHLTENEGLELALFDQNGPDALSVRCANVLDANAKMAAAQ